MQNTLISHFISNKVIFCVVWYIYLWYSSAICDLKNHNNLIWQKERSTVSLLEYISFIVLVYAGKLYTYANSVLLRKLSVKPNVCLFSSAVLSSFLPNIIDICTPSTIYMVLMEYTCMNGINKLKHYLKLILIIH